MINKQTNVNSLDIDFLFKVHWIFAIILFASSISLSLVKFNQISSFIPDPTTKEQSHLILSLDRSTAHKALLSEYNNLKNNSKALVEILATALKSRDYYIRRAAISLFENKIITQEEEMELLETAARVEIKIRNSNSNTIQELFNFNQIIHYISKNDLNPSASLIRLVNESSNTEDINLIKRYLEKIMNQNNI